MIRDAENGNNNTIEIEIEIDPVPFQLTGWLLIIMNVENYLQ